MNDTACCHDLADLLNRYAAECGIDLQELLVQRGAHLTCYCGQQEIPDTDPATTVTVSDGRHTSPHSELHCRVQWDPLPDERPETKFVDCKTEEAQC